MEIHSWTQPATATFTGRDAILQEIGTRLRRAESMAIRAARRMGKTSLLLALEAQLTEGVRAKRPGPERCPCFVDLRELSKNSASQFYADFVDRCVSRLSDLSSIKLPRDLKAATADLHSALGWTPVLLIDETEVLGRIPDHRDVLDFFNTLTFGADTAAPACQLVLVGGFRLWDLLTEESTSPLATRLSWIVLGGLNLDVSAELSVVGYHIPALYQYFNQHDGGTTAQQQRRLELLERFGEEGRAVLLSWWRGLGESGQTLIAQSPRREARLSEHCDFEALARLFGTGLLQTRQATELTASAVCRLLARFSVAAKPRGTDIGLATHHEIITTVLGSAPASLHEANILTITATNRTPTSDLAAHAAMNPSPVTPSASRISNTLVERRFFTVGCVLSLVVLALVVWAFWLGNMTADQRMLIRILLSLSSGFLVGCFVGAFTFESKGIIPGAFVTATGGFGVWVFSAFVLMPAGSAFGVVIQPHGPRSTLDTLDSGTVVLQIGEGLMREQIGAKGQAHFNSIPNEFDGKAVSVRVDNPHYDMQDPHQQLTLGTGSPILIPMLRRDW